MIVCCECREPDRRAEREDRTKGSQSFFFSFNDIHEPNCCYTLHHFSYFYALCITTTNT